MVSHWDLLVDHRERRPDRNFSEVFKVWRLDCKFWCKFRTTRNSENCLENRRGTWPELRKRVIHMSGKERWRLWRVSKLSISDGSTANNDRIWQNLRLALVAYWRIKRSDLDPNVQSVNIQNTPIRSVEWTFKWTYWMAFRGSLRMHWERSV